MDGVFTQSRARNDMLNGPLISEPFVQLLRVNFVGDLDQTEPLATFVSR
jgi:hypothetical protein